MSGVPAAPKYRQYHVTEDGVVHTGNGRVMAMQISGDTTNSECQLHDAAGATNEIIDIHAPTNQTKMVSYHHIGGIPFQTACYADLTGASAEVWIWLDIGA